MEVLRLVIAFGVRLGVETDSTPLIRHRVGTSGPLSGDLPCPMTTAMVCPVRGRGDCLGELVGGGAESSGSSAEAT